MPVFDHFGFLAPYYEKFIPLRNPEEIINKVGLPVQGAILDAGGGTGRVSKSLVKYADYIVLYDLSFQMLNEAKSSVHLSRVNGHAEAIPFPDKCFERVIMIDALHHVCSQEKTIAELLRITKPGGRIIIEEPDFTRFLVKLIALIEKIMLMRSHFLTPKRISDLFLSYPGVRVTIDRNDFNAWIICEKEGQI